MDTARSAPFQKRLAALTSFASLLLVACILGSRPPSTEAYLLHQRHHQKLYGSPYFSLHKTKALPRMDFAEGNMEDIKTALATRSYNSEIIVLVFTSHSVRWMVHYARMCQTLGFDHFIAVGSMESDCDVFHKQWCSTDFGGPGSPVPGADSDNATSAAAAAAALCEQAYPGCAWISANQTFDGDLEWQHMSKRPVERLWLFRYWFALVALRQGVNTLISDLDVVISGGAPQQQQDPPTQLQFEPPYSYFYEPLKSAPLDKQHFYQMPGSMWPNGGLIYIQNAHPEGPVAWMLDESIRMGLDIYRHRDAEPADIGAKTLAAYCSGNDQDCLEVAMLAAGLNRSVHEWRCLSRMVEDGVYEGDFKARWNATFSGTKRLPVPFEGQRVLDWRRWNTTLETAPAPKGLNDTEIFAVRPMMPADPLRSCAGQAQCHRLAEYGRSLIDMPARFVGLFNPPEAIAKGWHNMSEIAVSSPQYLLGNAEPLVYGWSDTHPERTFTLVNHLVAFGPTFGWSQHRRKGGGRHNRMHIIQAHGLWHAPLPLPERLLRVSQALVNAAAATPSSDAYRQLIRSLMVASIVTRRTPVLPAVRCGAASWIQRDNRARHGFADPSFVTITAPWKVAAPAEDGKPGVTGEEESDNALCAPWLSFWDECQDSVVLSDFHLHQDILSSTLSEATVMLSTEDADGAGETGETGGASGAGGAGRRALREATVGEEAEAEPAKGPAPSAAAPFRQMRESEASPEGGRAHVLWLSGDLEAALRLSRVPAEMKAHLGPREITELDRLANTCPDYAYEERFLLRYR